MRALQIIKRIENFIKYNLGLDLRKLVFSLIELPRFIKGLHEFKSNYKGRVYLSPYFNDWKEEGGTASGEYFVQDLYVARLINIKNPIKHIDIGSRVDGFVAHVASFREIEVFDIRVILSKVTGIEFKQVDLMKQLPENLINYSDSISCLHALEHFGLGRYGDPINTVGHILGFKNLALMLKDDGLLYLSVPIGLARIEFNGQRILNPIDLIKIGTSFGLKLISFAYVNDCNDVVESVIIADDIAELSNTKYSLGIFSFKKTLN